ncbi:MAG: RluA family pseudouridine synthase [Acidobacteria bacterium]|nr:RluA family pseudouridine synthase [Acidobacteriota bacterium]
MSTRRRTIRAINIETRPLVAVVAAVLRDSITSHPTSKSDARRVVMAGAVRVNGQKWSVPSAPVPQGARLEIAFDLARLPGARKGAATIPEPRVLFEDPHVVAVDKPEALPTHATADPGRPDLVTLVARRLGVRPGELGVHQRLDAGTSGVVIFARTPEANAGLARQFEARAVEKVYLAVVDARRRPDLAPGDSWVEHAPLAMDGRGRRARMVAIPTGGQAAETAFRVRARAGERLLIEVRPKTGRKHQIRAHLAAARLRIVGDAHYGWSGPPIRMMLHARSLSLMHPAHGTPLAIEAPLPPGFDPARDEP